jgi:hypothetical protein
MHAASKRRIVTCVVLPGMLALMPADAFAQGPPGTQPPARSAREAAPVDFTGYWVSVISEDWRWRMVTPLRGDFASVPLNAAGRKIGEAWDPARDEADGLQCKAYGAAAIMRMPTRVRISWEDDNTLKVETDAGSQTRLFHFTAGTPPASPSWQGHSVANWERPLSGEVEPPTTFGIFARRTGTRGRALEVTTRALRPGYLRKNGVPYSDQAVVTEYYTYRRHPTGEEWFTVTTIVRDPVYLNGPFVTSSDFKKEPDGARWRPTPCETR